MKKFIIVLLIITLFPATAFAQLSLYSINNDLHANYSTTTATHAYIGTLNYVNTTALTLALAPYALIVNYYDKAASDIKYATNGDLHGNYTTTILTQAWVNAQGFLTSANLSTYALKTYVNGTDENIINNLLPLKSTKTATDSLEVAFNKEVIDGDSQDVQIEKNRIAIISGSGVTKAYVDGTDENIINNLLPLKSTKATTDSLEVAFNFEVTDGDSQDVAIEKNRVAIGAIPAGVTKAYVDGTDESTIVKVNSEAVGLNNHVTALSAHGHLAATGQPSDRVEATDGSGNWQLVSVASIGGGVTNAVDLNTTASAITEATNQQGYNDSAEVNTIKSAIYGFEETGKPTLSYDPTTVTLTITGAHYVWCNGKRYLKPASQTIAHTVVTGQHYFYYNTSGVLTVSMTEWDILTTAQIATVMYNAEKVEAPKGLLHDERHGRIMSSSTHLYLHRTRGASSLDLFPISGYSLQPANPSNAGNLFAVTGGNVYDEDIKNVLTDRAGATAPPIFWREGATGEWTWKESPTTTALLGTTYIKYNRFNAGTWDTFEVGSDNYVNMWLVATNAYGSGSTYRYKLLVGQNVYTTLAAAQAATFATNSWGTLPFNEYRAIQQITLRARSTYTGATGRFRIESVTSLYGISSALGAFTATSHNSLSGRSTFAAHPLSSISVTGVAGDAQTQADSDSVALNIAKITNDSEDVQIEKNRVAIAGISGSNQTVTVTAGEALTAGQVVSMINEAGVMKAYHTNISYTAGIGTEWPFSNFACEVPVVAVLDATHFVMAYRKTSDTYGYAQVGLFTNNKLTFGTPVKFSGTGNSYYFSIAVLDTTHFIVSYCDFTSATGKCVAGVTDGNITISSFGTPAGFSGASGVSKTSTTKIDSTHFVTTYINSTDTYGYTFIGLITGTTITTVGTPVKYSGTTAIDYPCIALLDATHFVVGYKNSSDSYGYAIIGATDGATTISSYGTPVKYSGTDNVTYLSAAYMDATHFVLSYRNETDSGYGYSIVGITSGTTISSYGTKLKYSGTIGILYNSIFSIDSTHFGVSYQKSVSTYNGYGVIGVTSGTTISSYGTPVSYSGTRGTQFNSAFLLDSTHFITTFMDPVGTGYGYAAAGTFSGTTISGYSTQTTDYSKICGISQGVYNSGATTCSVLLAGVDANQSGLNPGEIYYSAADFSLTTNAVSLSIMKNSSTQTGEVKIGTAKDATHLVLDIDYK